MNDIVKMDNESAKQEFQRICDSWKAEVESDGENSDVAKQVIAAIEKGRVQVLDGKEEGHKLRILQKLGHSMGEHEEITYNFPLARDMMQMDNFKEDQGVKKAMALVASMSRIGQPTIGLMGGPDFVLAQAIASCFLGV